MEQFIQKIDFKIVFVQKKIKGKYFELRSIEKKDHEEHIENDVTASNLAGSFISINE